MHFKITLVCLYKTIYFSQGAPKQLRKVRVGGSIQANTKTYHAKLKLELYMSFSIVAGARSEF